MKQEVAEALQALKEAGSPLWAKLLAQHVLVNGWMPLVVALLMLLAAAILGALIARDPLADCTLGLGIIAALLLLLAVGLLLAGISVLLAPELTLLT